MYIPQALAPNITAILSSRVMQGIFGSVGNTMVAGTIADMFPKENRSLPMGVFVVCVFWSQAISISASSLTVSNPQLGWRWVFWWQAILALIVFILVVFFLAETRADILLIRRAKYLSKRTNTSYRTEHQDGISSMIATAARNVSRPVMFFFTEPIVAFLALWIG
jgi:MFS family permease